MLRFTFRTVAGSLVTGAIVTMSGCVSPGLLGGSNSHAAKQTPTRGLASKLAPLSSVLAAPISIAAVSTPSPSQVVPSQVVPSQVVPSAWTQASPTPALARPVVIAAEANAPMPPVMSTSIEVDGYSTLADQTEPVVANVQAINLASALAMTAGNNPEVNFARQQIAEAFAQLQAADAMWLPSIRAGGNYNKHEGSIQDVAGQMIDTSRGSLYTGFGSQAVGASSPAVPGLLMDFHVSDALFQPRVARQNVAARRQASRAVSNDLLMQTAIAYVDLLEAMQFKAVYEQTLVAANSLAKLTTDFAETGQGLRADADRANVELSFRNIDVRRADETIRVASIRLSQLLHADAAVTLEPVEPMLVPIEMVKLDSSVASMVSMGLLARPELAESKHLVRAAIERYDREKYAPFVPSVLLGMSYGGNGGGLGGDIDRFNDRLDFDAAAWWEVRNLGQGERAARSLACARVEQAKWQQVRTMDQVAAEVAQAYAEVAARREQIELARSAITAADDSYRRNSERIRDGQGLPIEVLQSLQALDTAKRQYVGIIADYNRSQFRLQRALGWPVETTELGAEG